MSDWSWRDRDRELNAQLNLLYEPGNWGDILKGLWAVAVVRHLGRSLRVLDPFSGARHYPLTEPTRQRLCSPALRPFRELQRKALKRQRLASTGLLVEWACKQAGLAHHTTIAERDPERRESWRGHAEIVEEAPLELLRRSDHDLILWDPYDFFEQWSHALPLLLAQSRRAPVLIYSYNKSPRGVSQLKQYESLRRRLPQEGWLVGRLPADVLLPRAYHEVLLLGEAQLCRTLAPDFKRVTGRITAAMARQGCFEMGKA